MNNLLFTALLITLIYCFFYYLPQQKKLIANPPLQHNRATQTELSTRIINDEPETIECPSHKSVIDTKELDNLKKAITQKHQTIIGLDKKNTDNLKTIQELQAQIRELVKRPSKPTNSKSTQTENKDLENTLDTLIKDIQALNNEL